MELADGLVSDLGHALGRSGPAAPFILLVASLVEYVFPPFPGDLLVLLGAWYAVKGVISWPVALCTTTAGAVLGSAVDYGIGWWLSGRLDAGASRRGPLSTERLARFVRAYRRWGPGLLLLNRFMPGLRAFVFVAAGAARLPLPRVLLLGGLSAALWNGLLLAAGALVVKSLPELIELFDDYSAIASAVLLALVLAGLATLLVRGRLRAAARGER